MWYQPTYARPERIADYAAAGYRGCIGRTLDRRISFFPDGRAYVCSFLFDTDLHFATMVDGQVVLNRGDNEFDLCTRVLGQASCGDCKAPGACLGRPTSPPGDPEPPATDTAYRRLPTEGERTCHATGPASTST
ncbi:MAG: hypothetical protein ACRDRZ_11505 [Pseudonocardiaceae bacterium]